jgi:hypothetical protein
MTWEMAKQKIEARALVIHRREAGTPLHVAVRDVLRRSPALWAAYREAMADGEQQEFVSRRPHHVIHDSQLEYMARKRVYRSRVPMTLRDAMLLAFRTEVKRERRGERERDRRLEKKRQAAVRARRRR